MTPDGHAENPTTGPQFDVLQPRDDRTDAPTFARELPVGPASTTPPRPYTLVNFVTSVDGRVTVDGRSRALGDDGDLAMLKALREHADAILVGTRTLAIERYGKILTDPDARARREAAGRAAQPLLCTVSRSGRLPLDIPLFTEPGTEVVVFSAGSVASGSNPERTDIHATVHFEPLATDPAVHPLAQAFATLYDRYGVRTLVCEGGPILFAALLAEHLVDELCLTLSPKLVCASGARSILPAGAGPDGGVALTLASVLRYDESLLLRYALASE